MDEANAIVWKNVVEPGLLPFGAAVERIALLEWGGNRNGLSAEEYDEAGARALNQLVLALREISNDACAERVFGIPVHSSSAKLAPISFDV